MGDNTNPQVSQTLAKDWGDLSVSKANQASSSNFVTPRGTVKGLIRRAMSPKYRTNSVDAGEIRLDKTGLTIKDFRIDFNGARVQSHCCERPFANPAMLERHKDEVTRTCTRCKIRTWYTCKTGLGAWSSEPSCEYGCETHRCCFDRMGEMQEHFRQSH
jgi:hypothetical protein